MAQSILAQGARNVATGHYVAIGGGQGTQYFGPSGGPASVADPTGVNDSTQAFLDAMNGSAPGFPTFDNTAISGPTLSKYSFDLYLCAPWDIFH